MTPYEEIFLGNKIDLDNKIDGHNGVEAWDGMRRHGLTFRVKLHHVSGREIVET
jgi:hypothetical protein